MNPDDDARRGGFIVLLILHAVTGRIQHCQEKEKREVSGATLPLLLQLLGSPEPKSESWTVLGAVYRKRRTMWEAGALLPAYAPPLLPAPQEGRHGKHRTGMSVVSQPHYLAAVIRHN